MSRSSAVPRAFADVALLSVAGDAYAILTGGEETGGAYALAEAKLMKAAPRYGLEIRAPA